ERWPCRSGWPCRSRRTGAGCDAGRTAPGIPPCASSASASRGTGRRSLNAWRPRWGSSAHEDASTGQRGGEGPMANLTIQQAMLLAVQQQEVGNLQQAEHIYRAVLQADPHQVEALLLLGLVAQQRGRLEEAVTCLHQVLRHKPAFAVA